MDRSKKTFLIGLAAALVFGAGALLAYWGSDGRLGYTEPAGNPSLSLGGFTLIAASERAAFKGFEFHDGDGAVRNTADFAGRVVLVNLWATWCPPCVAEMGALDSLQGKLGGAGFQVAAVSLDRGGEAVVRQWFAKNRIAHLGLYTADPEFFEGAVLPTSILLDAGGRVAWQGAGQRDWNGAEAEAMIRAVMAEAAKG